MKLISLTIILICLSVDIKAQNHHQENFPFPPQFQKPNSGLFTTDNSFFLPPDSHITAPYFPLKNIGKLPYQFLPVTGTKAPAMYPTPFPLIISSTLMSNFDDHEEGEINEIENKNGMSSTQSSVSQNKLNHTEKSLNTQNTKRRQMRALPKMFNYQHTTDKIDKKFPSQYINQADGTEPAQTNQTPASRRTIISTETFRNDLGPEHAKAISFQGQHYIPPSVAFISSTTEPAIPILRLSNEMDLDGSFSYEALGADQTHYVQHSRMENVGTDKEEQVVEGSYSYVGDNGQTYTVHYIADSNGFRASGEHLPVPPPVPEIIQRAVQYNLAEEAKKPPHLKTWQNDEKEQEISNSDKNPHYALPRNLFTGRTPEAFSSSFSQANNKQNNLINNANSQVSIKANNEFIKDQTQVKINNEPISPQVTFLASQGAHVPSLNTAQQSIARMFTTEKSTMPQLINYEAYTKDSEQENNKAFWRLQYGLNTNNENQSKNTISRSFTEGDDVMINFSDMTPEQYTSMIRSQLEPSTRENNKASENPYNDTHSEYQNQDNNINNFYPTIDKQEQSRPLADSFVASQQSNEWEKKIYDENHNRQSQVINENKKTKSQEVATSDTHQNIITQYNFIPPSQMITQSYDYDINSYEPKRIKTSNANTTKVETHNVKSNPSNNNDKNISPKFYWPNTNKNQNEARVTTTQKSPFINNVTNIKFTDFIRYKNNEFSPILNTNENKPEKQTTTTETNIEDMFENNIFLKNLIIPLQNNQNYNVKAREELNKPFYNKKSIESKTDNIPKLIQIQMRPLNEFEDIRKNPVNISDILNYVSLKNSFESNKITPKIKPIISNNVIPKNEIYFIPIPKERKNEETLENNLEQNSNNIRSLNHQQQEELRGIIKKYKILHRNNNVMYTEKEQLRRDLTPPTMNIMQSQNLPPLGRAGPMMKSYLPPIYI